MIKFISVHFAAVALLLFCIPSSVAAKQIDESRYVMINGIEQWITIRGNSDKPILLILHGGPGSTMSPYSASVYKDWENDFIIAQWDQRGAGRTYGKNGPAELTPEYLKANPLTVDQFSADGIAVTEYLLKHLSKSKLILFGSSWGSVPGIRMASARPELFYAYIGHSQIVNPSVDMLQSYIKVRELASVANDQESLNKLDALGPPPYADAKSMGGMIRVIKKYERQAATAPVLLATITPEYDNPTDEAANYAGDDYSFANYAGDQKLGLKSMAATINFDRDHTTFLIPIYLIQGELDLLTTKRSTKAYFDKISAPDKQYLLLPTSAHGFNQDVMEKTRAICSVVANL